MRAATLVAAVSLLGGAGGNGAAHAAVASVSSAVCTATVDANGPYTVTIASSGWTFSGDIGQPLNDVTVAAGTDNLGDYQEIAFSYVTSVSRQGAIRVYLQRPLILFTTTYRDASPNQDPFPVFTGYPKNLYQFSYTGVWAHGFGPLGHDSPWLFFDEQTNAFLLSPASHFTVADMSVSDDGAIVSGIDLAISKLPQGFTHKTLLAVGNGINATFDTWGMALTDLHNKLRPANDADVLLKYLSYWTDALSTYYYDPKDPSQYEGTLLAVKTAFQKLGIRLGSMQLDSWWYLKGDPPSWAQSDSGIYEMQADPSLFPHGLTNFRLELGIPLVAHARWIDDKSPYRNRNGNPVSGNVIRAPELWREIARYLHDSGVVVFEQDWLSATKVDDKLRDQSAFLQNMASSMKEFGINMQYCMPRPRHFLAGATYDNLTSIRVSSDRFGWERWESFLYDSRLASALGIWPFTDNMRSAEIKNLLLATLSAGPVGIGDPVETICKENLLQAIRPDGLIVKPDAPIVPTDGVYLADAKGMPSPMIAYTYTDHGPLRALYIFAYARVPGGTSTANLKAGSVGVSGGQVYLYDYFGKTGQLWDTSTDYSVSLDTDGSYFIAAPVGKSGIAFLGDPNKFVSRGRQRIALLDDNGTLSATIAFADGEKTVTVHGYAPSAPVITAVKGSAELSGYDPTNHLFSVTVHRDTGGTSMIQVSLPANADLGN